jgi:hypothetical protein
MLKRNLHVCMLVTIGTSAASYHYSSCRVGLAQITTIQIKSTTKRRLQKLGRKGDTYDDIVRRLINGSEGG